MNLTNITTSLSTALERTTSRGGVVRRGGPPVDLSYYVVPQNTVDMVKKVCYLGITPCLILPGLAMNILCFLLFYRMRTKSSTTVFLITLAVADIIYVLFAGLHVLFVASGYYEFPFTKDQRIRAVPYFYSCLRLVPGRFGALLTLAISMERMLCVIYPLHIKQISTKRNATCAVCFLIALTIACHAPMMLINTTKLIYINATKTFTRIVTPSEFGKDEDRVDAIYSITDVLFNFIPVTGVMISCAVTAYVVFSSAKLRSKLVTSSKSRYEIQVTKSLLALIFVFIVCKSPGTLLGLIIFIKMKPYKYDSNVYEVALAIAYIPLVLNSVVNLIIYYKTSTMYRGHIQNLLPFLKPKEENKHGNEPSRGMSTKVTYVSTVSTNASEEIIVSKSDTLNNDKDENKLSANDKIEPQTEDDVIKPLPKSNVKDHAENHTVPEN